MIYLLACILCTFCLGLIFKVLGSKNHRLFNIIFINYFICSIIGIFKVHKTLFQIDQLSLFLSLSLGLLFIVGFNVFALSIQQTGLGLTSLVQKLSVITTVIAAIMLGEDISNVKTFGLILSIFAMYLLFVKDTHTHEAKPTFSFLLFFSFIIASCIEIVLLYYNKNQFIIHNATQFTCLVFISSTFFGFFYFLKSKSSVITKDEICWGLILGIPNYFSIEYLNKALENGMNGSQFFPLLNITVILLSGLSGFLIFKEHFSNRQMLGYILAFISLLMLSLS